MEFPLLCITFLPFSLCLPHRHKRVLPLVTLEDVDEMRVNAFLEGLEHEAVVVVKIDSGMNNMNALIDELI